MPAKPTLEPLQHGDRIFRPPLEVRTRVFKVPTPTGSTDQESFSDGNTPAPVQPRLRRRRRGHLAELDDDQEWYYAVGRKPKTVRREHTSGLAPPWSCQLMAGRAVSEPCPLLYVKVRIGSKQCWALLDSGAADNFIAHTTVTATQIPTHPLGMPWAVSLGNGDIVYTTQYALTNLQLGDYSALTCFKVLATDLAMVLGYPFLLKHRPHIDWRKRTLLFQRRGKEYLIKGYPGSQIPRSDLMRVEDVTGESLLQEWVQTPATQGSHYRRMNSDANTPGGSAIPQGGS